MQVERLKRSILEFPHKLDRNIKISIPVWQNKGEKETTTYQLVDVTLFEVISMSKKHEQLLFRGMDKNGIVYLVPEHCLRAQ